MFPGESGVDQLVEIIKVLGTPSREQIRDMNPNYNENKFPQIRPTPFTRIFKSRTPQEAIDFVASLLVYSPLTRPSAYESLLHPFFDELRDPETRLPNGQPLPNLFDFSSEERAAAPEIIERLVPEWYSANA